MMHVVYTLNLYIFNTADRLLPSVSRGCDDFTAAAQFENHLPAAASVITLSFGGVTVGADQLSTYCA